MGLTFLAPLFLAGLAALAVPVIVHLTNRPKRDAQPFPSLMFLQQVPFRSVRRQRIRHWWLLAIRAAVVVLVAAAFARPLLTRWDGLAGAFGGGEETVVLLDHSYSMRYGDRWQRAVAAARRVVEGLGPGDRASIVLFADRPVSLGQATQDRATLLVALGNAAPGFGTTRYATGLQAARDILERSPVTRRRVVVISDFQRAGWRPDEGVRLPAGTRVEPVSLAEPAVANLAVTGLSAERSFQGQREEAIVSARVANLGRDLRRGVRVALDVDGRTIRTMTVNVDAGASAAAVFPALPLGDRPVRVIARIEPDQLPADDAEYAVVAPGDVIRVLLLAPGGARGASFLQRALQVGSTPRFEVALSTAEGPSSAELARPAVVVLADPAPAAAGLATRLGDFVRRGGGVVVILGGRAVTGGWAPAWRALLGGVPGAVTEPPGAGGVTLGALQYDHPVFEPFRQPKSGDFGSARVYRYRRFDPDTGSAVLARYLDGSPALVEHPIGSGKVLVWTSGMDNIWSDLPVQPVFLPLIHQVVRYLAGYVERKPAFTVGYVLDLESARLLVGGEAELSVESPGGRRTGLGGGREPSLSLDEPGFYTVRTVGSPGTSGASGVVAVNVDPAEADLAPLDVDAFLAAVSPAGEAVPSTSAGASRISPAERERRQGFWWYLVIGVTLLALAETFLSNRLPAVGRAST